MGSPSARVLAVSLLLGAKPLAAQTTPTPHLYLSDEAVVNTQTTSNQRRPSVAFGADGNYMVVWHSDASQLGFYDIKGQLFTPGGVKIGSEFQVDQAGANRVQYTAEIAAGGDGNYVVVWSDFNQTVTDSEVWMRRYDSAANPLAGAVQVNTHTTGQQRLPQVAADSTGKFVVVWESAGQDGDGLGVFGQQFSASGSPVGGEFAVNLNTTGDQDRAAVAMDGQGFTVLFNDGPSDVSGRDFGAFATPGEEIVYFVEHRTGAINTFGLGERVVAAHHPATGRVTGRRSSGGVLGNSFVIVDGAEGPCLGPRIVIGPRRLIMICDRLGEDDGLYEAIGQELREHSDGALVKVGSPFPLSDTKATPTVVHAASDAGGRVVGVFQTGTGGDGSGDAVKQTRGGAPDPGKLLIFDDNGDGVLDPNESATMSAFLANYGAAAEAYLGFLTGSLQSSSASRLNTVTIIDGLADYGTIPTGATGDCQSTGNCYGLSITGTRPAAHWDETVTETLNNDVHKTWLLHAGESFADVPTANPFYAFIENLLHNGVTAGGACGGYCPTDGVKRQQMAVFLLKSRFGASVTPPPATGLIFADVPASNPFAAWIEALYLLGVTGGCQANPLLYCPDAIVNRQQMAVFLLKMKEGSAYDPPDCAGIFTDVPCTPGAGFSDWIEELYNRQITGGCVANPLQYCPTNPTNRQQMAAFLVKTFELLLYGP